MALLTASQAYLASLYPAEDNHYLSIDELCAPHIRFFIAEGATGPVGCVALAVMGDYAEVKIHVHRPGARGRGGGRRADAALDAAARAEGLAWLRLDPEMTCTRPIAFMSVTGSPAAGRLAITPRGRIRCSWRSGFSGGAAGARPGRIRGASPHRRRRGDSPGIFWGNERETGPVHLIAASASVIEGRAAGRPGQTPAIWS